VKESKLHITESPMTGFTIVELPVMLEFKNHLLYVLRNDLLKLEAIYLPDDPPLGFVNGKPIYGREFVHVLHSSDFWLKEAKVVRPGETDYNIVKARPYYDRTTGRRRKKVMLVRLTGTSLYKSDFFISHFDFYE